MQTTDARTIRLDFVSVIKGISPRFSLYRDALWTEVDAIENVPGQAPRLFYVQMGQAAPVEDGIFGDGYEVETEVQVFANYGDIPDRELDPMITTDGLQLYNALERRTDPTLPGLCRVEYGGFEFEDAEPQDAWGAHLFTVRWLNSDAG